ncbi:hypothetical protein [Plantactinospora sonchi]|uniref:DUF3558 domain-containing protein n=1 Tax=Plantactinospora sonchi TaxID=1544735 RepID=A0ABU7S398_9ACTN
MRGRLCLIGAGLLLLAGCGDDPTPQSSLPAPEVVRLPAASAGGACQLVDYPTIEEVIGTRFDVSAASRHGKTDTCVLRGEDADQPELALSVSPTTADAAIFADEVVPSGGKTVKGLGKAAYRAEVKAARNSGPSLEVGWLTGDKRLVNLRYTFPDGEAQAGGDDFADKLVALAKKIDTSSL